MGQVMKETKGKYPPALIIDILNKIQVQLMLENLIKKLNSYKLRISKKYH